MLELWRTNGSALSPMEPPPLFSLFGIIGVIVMTNSKKAWIPAILLLAAAAALVAYSFLWANHGHTGEPPRIGQAAGAADRLGHPPGGKGEGAGGLFKTLGTVSVFLGAAGFSWFWFRRRLRSTSLLVRRVGKLLHASHTWLGWATVFLIAVHGIYFLIAKSHDDKIWTGLACFAILAGLAAYGFLIRRIRNRYTRTVHRALGIAWAPLLIVHAGGSAVAAVAAVLALGAAVRLLDRPSGKRELGRSA